MEDGCASERRRSALASLKGRRSGNREDAGGGGSGSAGKDGVDERDSTRRAESECRTAPAMAVSNEGAGPSQCATDGIGEEVEALPAPVAIGTTTEEPPVDAQLSKTVKQMAWICQECGHECVPIREESRCLCGHRMKEHNKGDHSQPFRCRNSRCACRRFFLIVAEGSWVLRCRCKHKHTDHDAATHKCNKPKCECQGFHSPWVCNCSHAWASHKQILVEREVLTLEGMMAAAALNHCDGPIEVAANHFETEVNRFDMLRRGL